MGRPLSFFRMHWDHEPIRFGPRAVPARSGRAKTRAWVIFQGRWRGPHAATGDRSRSSGSTGQLTRIGWFMGRGGEHELRTYRPAKGDERETEDFRATTGPASKIELMEDVVVIAGPEADDLVGNAQED